MKKELLQKLKETSDLLNRESISIIDALNKTINNGQWNQFNPLFYNAVCELSYTLYHNYEYQVYTHEEPKYRPKNRSVGYWPDYVRIWNQEPGRKKVEIGKLIYDTYKRLAEK